MKFGLNNLLESNRMELRSKTNTSFCVEYDVVIIHRPRLCIHMRTKQHAELVLVLCINRIVKSNRVKMAASRDFFPNVLAMKMQIVGGETTLTL